MKFLITSFIMCLLLLQSKAQIVDTNKSILLAKFSSVEQEATFIGGEEGFYKFLMNNLKYPAFEREKNISGKVELNFVVCEDGSICKMEVKKSVSKGLDNEALRVMQLIKKMKPAKDINGKNVPMYFSLPFQFVLE